MSVRPPMPRSASRFLTAAALLSAALSPAALAGPPCDRDACRPGVGSAGADRPAACRRAACGRPAGYACRLEVDSEPVERSCALIDTDVICVPPITTSPLAALCDTLCGRKDGGRKSARGCGARGCAVDACDGGAGCGARRGGMYGRVRKAGWLARLTNHGRGCGGGIRCVNSLDEHEYESGRRCVYEWSAVPVDACGRPLIAPDAADSSTPPAPAAHDVPPAPIPAPAPPTLEFGPDDDTGELDDTGEDANAAPAAPAQQGAAKQAIEE